MLLGARQFFERRGKSAPTARDYVQIGLVAMWDGIENAGWGTHDSSATVWKDLSGGGVATLPANVAVDGDAISFVGNDSISYPISTALASALASADMSLEMCLSILPYTSTANRTMCETIGMDGNILIYTPRSTTSSQQYVYYNYYGRANSAVGGVLDANGMFDGTLGLACSTSAMSGARYKNGTLVNNATFSQIPTITPTALRSALMGGAKLRSIRIYSRALTADEIAANYAIDKARFNLP